MSIGFKLCHTTCLLNCCCPPVHTRPCTWGLTLLDSRCTACEFRWNTAPVYVVASPLCTLHCATLCTWASTLLANVLHTDPYSLALNIHSRLSHTFYTHRVTQTSVPITVTHTPSPHPPQSLHNLPHLKSRASHASLTLPTVKALNAGASTRGGAMPHVPQSKLPMRKQVCVCVCKSALERT